MIRVHITLHSAVTGKVSTLGTAEICNVGYAPGQPRSLGRYTYRFTGRDGRMWREGFLGSFPRKKRLAWDLLFRCLLVAGLNDRVLEDLPAVPAPKVATP